MIPLYRSFAGTPVSAETTLAAARGRAPVKPESCDVVAGPDQPAERVGGEADVGRTALGSGADHDHDLAAGLVPEPAGELAEGAARDLLMEFGELAADCGGPVGGELGERPQRLRQAPRGLEGDQRLRRLEHSLELAGPTREKALEAEAVRRQTGGNQRGDDRRGPWQHLEVEVAVDAGSDQSKPRIGDRGRAGVGDEGDVVAALDPLGQIPGALRLVPLVVGDQPQRLDLEALQ